MLHGRIVLFDVDGTIAETEGQGHLPAFNQAFEEFGLTWQWSVTDYAALLRITGGFERMLAYAQRVGDPIAVSDSGQRILKSIHQRKNALYAERMAAGEIRPRKGFISLVQAIVAAGQSWAVVTTTSRANWDVLYRDAISREQAVPPPELAVCGEDVQVKKPDPQAYALALTQLKRAACDCVAIEDSRNGLLAARGAGLDTIVVRSQFFGVQEFPEAQLVVGELSELLLG